ncbi:MAG: hypothetical protein M0C28_07860 [Candidatus Moduliflexus flocculans]|nr:hypothetical protein [Candidatus Moduliflexus flocculans]
MERLGVLGGGPDGRGHRVRRGQARRPGAAAGDATTTARRQRPRATSAASVERAREAAAA